MPQPGRIHGGFPTPEKTAHGYQTGFPDLHWVPLSYLSASMELSAEVSHCSAKKVGIFLQNHQGEAVVHFTYGLEIAQSDSSGLFTTAYVTRGAAPRHGPVEHKPTYELALSHTVAALAQIPRNPRRPVHHLVSPLTVTLPSKDTRLLNNSFCFANRHWEP